jgi:hypothetical protein
VTPKTKAESPQALVETIERLERQSDTCYQGLQLLDRQWNYAAWLALTECLRRFESSLTPDEYGSGKHKIIGMNLGRAAGQMWKLARDYARPDLCAPSGFNWHPRVARECAIAFDVAWPYSMFCVDFPAWHRGLYAAPMESIKPEPISPRFIVRVSFTGTVVFAELKWPRKPYSPREIPQRDSELRKGIAQIKAIKLFLTANPTFLAERHHLARSLCDYQQVQYCVVSRDHLVETQDKEYPVYGYDVFEREMSGPKDIPSVLALLNSMDWLPQEGKDFTCQWIANIAGGVTVLSELFLLKERNASITTT